MPIFGYAALAPVFTFIVDSFFRTKIWQKGVIWRYSMQVMSIIPDSQAMICFQRGICELGLDDRSSAQTSLNMGNQLIGPPTDGTPGEREWGHPRWYQRKLHDLLHEQC